jgi:uncharacterized protein (DUF1697 family)
VAGQRYVALLRGINVGGKNLVAMADLRDAVAADGHTDVRTYIQSGNVLFTSDAPAASLEQRLEAALAARFGRPLPVLVRSRRQLAAVVTQAPPGFGTEPARYHSDVLFLKRPLTAAGLMRVLSLREGVDQAWPGRGVVYFARLSARLSQSRLGRITAHPEYQLLSIRSWTTTTTLLALLDAASPGGSGASSGLALSPREC